VNRSPADGVEVGLAPSLPILPRVEVTQPATVEHGHTLSRAPCHGRRVRLDGNLTGRSVVVRCPFCSQLCEVHFAPPQPTRCSPCG